MNYYPQRDDRIAELDAGEVTASELVQRHLNGSRLVKALHNMDYHRLFTRARPSGAADRSALPVSGDHEDAKTEVVWFMDVIGYDAVDIGTLAESWRSEPGTPVYVWPYLGEHPEGLGQEEAERWFRETPGRPVTADQVRELAAQVVRGPAGGTFVPGYVPGVRTRTV
ncbi:NADPH-dependent F420 reductase [Streptomyces sp. NPDC008137]|uniref:NADPH-dependent F420 reductase n=1 Tax=Streptomyces sp. NPDC008137 TaxID=3364813 RepID=UPI0036F173C5